MSFDNEDLLRSFQSRVEEQTRQAQQLSVRLETSRGVG